MEGNASVYQVNPVCRITGEGRAEFLRTWGPDFDQKGGGRGGGGEGGEGTGEAAQFVRGNYKSFLWGRGGECGGGGGVYNVVHSTAVCRQYGLVAAYATPCAPLRSRSEP